MGSPANQGLTFQSGFSYPGHLPIGQTKQPGRRRKGVWGSQTWKEGGYLEPHIALKWVEKSLYQLVWAMKQQGEEPASLTLLRGPQPVVRTGAWYFPKSVTRLLGLPQGRWVLPKAAMELTARKQLGYTGSKFTQTLIPGPLPTQFPAVQPSENL